VWEVTPSSFLGENAGFGEYMYVLRGEGTVTSADGATLELRPGVSFVARPGWRGTWHVRETIRKIYVIWRMPTQTAEPEQLPYRRSRKVTLQVSQPGKRRSTTSATSPRSSAAAPSDPIPK
jgi:uncharacterized cupin superfamily protein